MAKSSQAEVIKRATLAARKDFVGFSKRQEAEIIKLYQAAGRELAAQAIAHGNDPDSFALSQVMTARRKNLLAQIDAEIARLRVSLNAKIMASMRRSIDGGMAAMTNVAGAAGISGNITIGSSYIGVDGKVRRYDPRTTTLAASRWGQINRTAMDHLVRYRPGGLTFSQNIWSVNWEVQRTMRNMVNQSVLIGESSQKLAKKLTQYTTKRGLQARPGVYKSAYSNAWRLARTEINRAYHEGQIRYSQEKKNIIDGHIWRLGGGGPWFCVCPDLAGRFFPTGETPAKPHPMCMCYLEFHIIGDEKPEDKGPLEARTKKAIDLSTEPRVPALTKDKPYTATSQKDWEDGLSIREQKVYKRWSRTGFKDIRDFEFGNLKPGSAAYQKAQISASVLNRTAKNSPAWTGKTYRGIKDRKFGDVQTGDSVTFNSLTSTSQLKTVAEGFADRNAGIMYELKMKRGVDISNLADKAFRKEKEVLIRKNATFVVEDRWIDGSGVNWALLSEI